MLKIYDCLSLSGVPYLTYEALDEYAENVIADAAPENLKTPASLDVDSFLEFYLKLSVQFKKLSCNGKILGLTAFNDGCIEVFDEKNNHPKALKVRAGTVIVDNSLPNQKSEPRLRFTLMHEASHWLLHQKSFSNSSQFFVGENYLAAKDGRADYSRSQCEKTDIDRMERQADFLAAALLMPRPALVLAEQKYWNCYGQNPMQIRRGKGNWHNSHAKLLPQYIAGIFGVSKQASKIRLEKLERIVGKETIHTRLW